MNIEVSAENAFARKVNVIIPAQRVRSELDKAYSSVGRQARIRGFRKGKVPRKVLEAQFGPRVVSDVASSLIQEAYDKARTDHDLEPVSQPSVVAQGDLASTSDFTFTIAVEVRPTVTAAVYKDLPVYWPQWEVTDEQVEAAIESRRQGQGRLGAVSDRPVELGDRVQIELVVRDGEDELLSEPGTMVDTQGDSWLRGIEGALLGIEIGAEHTAEVTFDATARNEDLAGKTLTAVIKVLAIQAEVVPELSDELAEEMGFEGGVEGMRAAVRDQLSKGREEAARNQARANLLEALIEANAFEVPSGMVEQNLQLLMEELKLQQAYQGRDPRSVTFSQAQIADLRLRSAFAAKGGLLLESVAALESLEVTDADLEAKYVEIAESRGQTLEAIKGYFVKDDAVEDLRQRLIEEKTLDWLLDHAKVSHEPPVTETPVEAATETSAPASDAVASEE